ncbi:heterocyst frequency control protein PatD [Okeanomitos corallinicola TIOX110]|uniref:Heterocyst frequency control protein PatD n=1 Tax=Okeanomitos corallinicola TIOX110 TaxID=3133117 RepID=A0ABZ2UNX6_9CYAN
MSVNLEIYQKFVTLLELLSDDISENLLDAPGLRQSLIELKQYFVKEIASLTDLNSRQQSYHTEMSKQLRLLELDITFLQGAKKPETIQTRVNNIKERLNTLVSFCQAMIN